MTNYTCGSQTINDSVISDIIDFPNSLRAKFDLRFEIRDINYLHIHAHIAYMIWTLGSEIEIDITKTPGRFCCVSWLMGTIYVGFTHLRGSVICSHPIGCVSALQKKQLQFHTFALLPLHPTL